MRTPLIDFEQVYSERTWDHLNQNNGKFDVDNAAKMREILLASKIKIYNFKNFINKKLYFS